MIKTFKDPETERIFAGLTSKRLPADIQTRALRKLRMIDQSTCVEDLRMPPGNRFEALLGDRAGSFSIRINDKWRICFLWDGSDAYDVEITNHYGR